MGRRQDWEEMGRGGGRQKAHSEKHRQGHLLVYSIMNKVLTSDPLRWKE